MTQITNCDHQGMGQGGCEGGAHDSRGSQGSSGQWPNLLLDKEDGAYGSTR